MYKGSSFLFCPPQPIPAAAWQALVADLSGVGGPGAPAGSGVDTAAPSRQRAAADYHWYSPVLQQRLAGKLPQGVVRPRTVAEVMLVAQACARHHVPLTVRGGGTGNYGQCVPLHGGLSLDITGLDQVLQVHNGWARVQAGALMGNINDVLRQDPAPLARFGPQQLRMWPSTERIATLGGFIAGGHSGIGSMRHGILADPGNVRRLQVVTVEDPPRLIDLHGADIQKVHHAYGSNGILVEVDIATTPWLPWLHTIALFDTYAEVLAFGLAAGQATVDGVLDLFQLSAVERRITPYYAGLRGKLQGRDAMFAQVSPDTAASYAALVTQFGGELVVRGTESELLAQGLPSVTECAYNHTTLEALKTDRSVTYLQVAYPAPLSAELVAAQMQRFGDEVLMHHEFSRWISNPAGQLVAFALPLVQYFDEDQLEALKASFEADGCHIFDPHTWVLEDGGMKQVDEAQLAFKKLADPMGLMNPGKVRGWDEQVLGIQGGQL